MGQTLRDWYRYLEQQMHVSLSAGASGHQEAPADSGGGSGPPQEGDSPPIGSPGSRERLPSRTNGRRAPPSASTPSGVPQERRRGGRRPLTETREEIIRRLLDPELTLHEAAAILNLSKATVRRYTDQGKLACTRTPGGQRRFRLSALLEFLDRQAARQEDR